MWFMKLSIVYQPISDDFRHTRWLLAKSQLTVKLDLVIGLEVNVLAPQGLDQQFDHVAGDALAAEGGLAPDIDEIGVADAIGENAGGADDSAVGECDDEGMAVAEGLFELGGGAAVVEMIRLEFGFHGGPVDVGRVHGI